MYETIERLGAMHGNLLVLAHLIGNCCEPEHESTRKKLLEAADSVAEMLAKLRKDIR